MGSRVTVCGCGALGTVLANHLARAGVGHIRIVDRDFIETHNLQRQILFDEQDVADNLPKAEAAARKLRRINSAIHVEPVDTTAAGDCFNGAFAHFLASGYDVDRAISLANVAGALSTTKPGAQASMPTWHEVLQASDDTTANTDRIKA